MPIPVTCPKCHTRFNVSDKFAGQKGPCPKCKETIQVPTKEEEVVIHAPEEFGPKTATGEAVLKPIERSETKIGVPMIIAIALGAVLVVVVAFLVGRMSSDGGVSSVFLGIGAALLAPPIALAGYAFLRNDELEAYRGGPLVLRVVICAVVYACLWGLYAYVRMLLFPTNPPELYALVIIIPALVGMGAIAPLAALDFDFSTACIHYGVYLGVCVLLRLVMGLPAF